MHTTKSLANTSSTVHPNTKFVFKVFMFASSHEVIRIQWLRGPSNLGKLITIETSQWENILKIRKILKWHTNK